MAEDEALQQANGPTGRYATADGAADDDSLVRARLEDQIAWYDAMSQQNQRRFKQLKVCQIVVAAGIPVAAAASGRCGSWELAAR